MKSDELIQRLSGESQQALKAKCITTDVELYSLSHREIQSIIRDPEQFALIRFWKESARQDAS